MTEAAVVKVGKTVRELENPDIGKVLMETGVGLQKFFIIRTSKGLFCVYSQKSGSDMELRDIHKDEDSALDHIIKLMEEKK